MNGLVGKKAVITGAAGGIGKAISRLFAEQGASVVVAGRHRPNIEQALQELEGLKPSSTVPADPPSKHDMHLFNVRNLDGWKGLVKAHVSLSRLLPFPWKRNMQEACGALDVVSVD
jgi:NAD(P)-dependent dehydrogenase (short-subunit alcohol dehydrogenase family)